MERQEIAMKAVQVQDEGLEQDQMLLVDVIGVKSWGI